jgi:uncharacterized protein
MRRLALITSLSPLLASVAAWDAKGHTVDVTQRVAGTTLAGTLQLAEKVPSPLFVIVSGSGPVDRDGNALGPGGPKPDSLKLLARDLAKVGISSIRFDKRFLPSANPPTAERDLRFEILADDIAAWVNGFASDARFTRVIIVGHSEGATLGALAAQKSKAAGYVSIAGPAQMAAAVLRRQLAGQLPTGLIEANERILSTLEGGQTITAVPAELQALYRRSVQSYLISWLAIDPLKEVAKVSVPIAVVQGDADVQVGVDDALALQNAAKQATTCIVGGMNHVLKDAPANDVSSYFKPELPINKTLVVFLAAFASNIAQSGSSLVPTEGCRKL